ncbi:hypothetical protein QQ045_006944 [Rhodiola kirilowii]
MEISVRIHSEVARKFEVPLNGLLRRSNLGYNQFVSLEDYKVTNIEVLQVSMVEPDLGTPRLDLFVQLPNEGFIFPVEVNATTLQVMTMLHNQPDTSPETIRLEDSSPIPSPIVRIMLKMPAPMTPISIEMSPSDTFSMLKDKIHEIEHIPTNRISLHFGNKELPDQIPVRDFDGMEVGVSVKQSPMNSNSMGSEASQGSSRRMKIVVALATNMSKRIQVEVNVGDKQTVVESSLVSADLFTLFLFGKEMDEMASSLRGVSGIERGDAVVEMVLVYGGGRNNCMPGTTAKVTVALVPVNLKVTVTVTLSHCFGELRREMERLRKEKKVELPENWMFVYRKEKVLIENAASFEEFKVVDDDVIHIHSLVVV